MLRTSPERCAADIVDGMKRGRRRIMTGYLSSTFLWLTRLFPNAYPKVLRLLA
ncbi:hypothetical protein D3C86_1768800 [compost metagenome]